MTRRLDLLRPLTEAEAAKLPRVTPEQIKQALREAEPALEAVRAWASRGKYRAGF